ncbi:MAG TPA: LysM peptidoglycan-binding domain-containing protein [Chloroflexia bacterium]|nr:LysM peptidoglycan-binding domain-containing protein [Chloroflexia bacterium]
MEQLEKATIVVQWEDEMEFIPVQFNPTEISLDKSAQIAEIAIPGLDTPLLQFVRGQTEKLTLDLFFDTTEDGMGTGATSVTTLTDRIYELVKIEPSRHAPPLCAFIWNSAFPGNSTSAHIGNQRRDGFDGIVESVRQKFMLFSPQGVPLRATLTVTFREYKTLDYQLRQLNLNSPDRTHSHLVQAGDTLSSIAGKYYKRPGEWRRIAEANDIKDPRRLVAGTLLTVPRMGD